jgi:hypothetical protein
MTSTSLQSRPVDVATASRAVQPILDMLPGVARPAFGRILGFILGAEMRCR